jgi:hypothetical protein
MAAKEIIVKKYVARLSGDEREQLATLIRKGKSPAHRLMKARILLKSDVSEAGEGRSHRGSGDQRIDGLPGAQTTGGRRHRGRGEPQATIGACHPEDFRRREGSQADSLGLFRAPQGPRALDIAVVGEQGRRTEHRRLRQQQHDRAELSKKHPQAASETAMGRPAEGQQRRSWRPWKTCRPCTRGRAIPIFLWFAWTRPRSN